MTDMTNIHELDRGNLLNMINLSLVSDEPLLIFGTPGIGKSDTVREVSFANGYEMLDVRAGNIPPEDFAGIAWPEKDTGRVKRLMPDVIAAAWAKHEASGKPVVIFLDEINHTPLAAQGALYSLVLDREAAGYELPPETRIIAAGNPEGTGSISEEMSRALLDRFALVTFAGPSNDEFDVYAGAIKMNPIVRAFLKDNPDMLNKFDPDEQVSPTPRSWSRLANMLENCDNDSMKMRAAHSVVGAEAAFKINAFIEMFGKVPTFDEIVANAEKAKLPRQMSAQYMAGMVVANRLATLWTTRDPESGEFIAEAQTGTDRANTRAVIHKAVGTYLARLPVEIRAMAVASLINTKSGITGQPAVTEFVQLMKEAGTEEIKKTFAEVSKLGQLTQELVSQVESAT